MFRILLLAGAAPLASCLRFFRGVAALALLLPMLVLPAALAADTVVAVPWGDWLATFLVEIVLPLALAALAWLLRFVPAAVHEWCLRLFGLRIDQILEPAIQYGINATAGAVKGRKLSFVVGSEVARQALDYVAKHAPATLKTVGIARMNEKILARLDFDDLANVGPVR